LRVSKIREETGCTVIGSQRGEQMRHNPDSDQAWPPVTS
jgi:K+/H+ antiporter YhaU regulatory subunit KhtT